MPQGTAQNAAERFRQGVQEIADKAIAEARQGIRSELDQARAERNALDRQLSNQRSGPARAELASEVQKLDLKIEKLEEVLAKFESKVTTTTPPPSTRFIPGTTPPPNFPAPRMQPFDPTEIVATSLGILFVAFPLTLAIVRFLWKRATPAPAPALSQEHTRRFDRLEQSVDAIAIEVERISENQRYLTKLLGEAKQTSKIGS